MIKVSDRKEAIYLIKEAVTAGAREPQACEELGILLSTDLHFINSSRNKIKRAAFQFGVM